MPLPPPGDRRFEARLALLFMAVSLVPVSAATVVLESSEAQLLERKVGDHLATAVQLKQGAIERWTREKAKSIEVLRAELQELPPAVGSAELRARLGRHLGADPDLAELLLLDAPEGTILLSTAAGQEGKMRDNEDYFLRGLRGPTTQGLFYSLTAEQYAIVVSTPVDPAPLAGPGEPEAVLAARMDPSTVLDLLAERGGLGETGRTYATNRFATVLAASPVGAPLAAEPVASCAGTGGGQGPYTNEFGVEAYAVWRWDEVAELCYVAEQASWEAFAPLAELRRVLVGGMVLLGLLMLGLSLYVSRLVARPVAAQAAAEARWRSLLETLPAGVAEVGREGRVRYGNPALGALRARDGAPLLGAGERVLGRLRDAGAAPDLLLGLGQALRDRRPLPPTLLELPSLRHDLTLALHPLEGQDESILVAVDVSGQKDAERTLVRELKDIDRLRTQFINQAAHELNTPLTPLKLQLYALRRSLGPDSTERQRRALDMLERNVERLTGLVRDLLDVARIQAGRLAPETKVVDLHAAVREAAEAFQETAAQKGLRLRVRGAGGTRVRTDPRRLGQVLFNLLGNAVKFTPPGGEVVVETALPPARGGSPPMAEVHVADTGVGLEPADIPKLFQPFVQVHPGHEGTGLGLYITKGLVEQQGGRVWCASAGRGKGATFSFSLPLAREGA